MKQQALIFTFLVSLITFSAYSQTSYKNEFGFRSDNDAYLAQGQDRYYTNGLFITFRHAIKIDTAISKTVKKTWETELGQKLYNAQSGSVPDISFVDRPFAGYLYVGGKFNWFYKNESVLGISLQAGTIGPASKGEDVQELLHKIVGFYTISGWQYQVNNELQVNMMADYTYLITRSGNGAGDISFEGQVRAGTTFPGASAGFLMRLGKINPLSKSLSKNSRISNSGEAKLPAKEFFFFLRPQLNFVAYDATVQGGMFNTDKGPVTYDTKPLVFAQELGVNFAHKRWTGDFSLIFLSREVKSTAKSHQFGAISLFYQFD